MIDHPVFREYTMTVAMHDYAFPKDFRVGPFGLLGVIKRTQRPVQIYGNLSLDFVRNASNEEIGRFVKELLSQLDESKRKIESEKVTL